MAYFLLCYCFLKTNMKKPKFFAVPLLIKEMLLAGTNKNQLANFQREKHSEYFLGGLEQTNHVSQPAVLHLLPGPPPQSRPTTAELEPFCQIAIVCNLLAIKPSHWWVRHKMLFHLQNVPSLLSHSDTSLWAGEH